MKIIKAGKYLIDKRVICKYCECEFEVEQKEYKLENDYLVNGGLPNYSCNCPWCKCKVYFS